MTGTITVLLTACLACAVSAMVFHSVSPPGFRGGESNWSLLLYRLPVPWFFWIFPINFSVLPTLPLNFTSPVAESRGGG